MLTPFEAQQKLDRQARERVLKEQALTPQHEAAEAAMGCEPGEEGDEAARQHERVRHLADPYPPEAPEVAEANLGKRYNQAYDIPCGYPQPARVSAEDFRRGPIRTGEAAYSPGYTPSARPVPVPAATLSAAAISRPLMTDGRARPSAPAGG